MFPNQLKHFPRVDLPWDDVRYLWELFSIPCISIKKNQAIDKYEGVQVKVIDTNYA